MEKPPEDHGEPIQRWVNKVEDFEQPHSRNSASASISWSPALQGSSPKSRAGSPRKGTRWLNCSGLSYIYLQKSTNADETLEAKLAFERYASKFKVQVKSDQADSGRFAENKFMADVKEAGQALTLSAVSMLIFKVLLQKEGAGLCKTNHKPC